MAKIIAKAGLGSRKRKSKAVQYGIGGLVAVVILAVWLTSPIMGNVFSSAALAAGNPFSSKVSDVSSLSSDGTYKTAMANAAAEIGSHDSGDGILSTLFGSGQEEEQQPSGESVSESAGVSENQIQSADVSVPAVTSAGGGSGVSEATRAKLSAVSALGGSGASSMTSGGDKHSKFFGSGNTKAKIQAIDTGDVKKASSPADVKGQGLTALKNATAQGKQAAVVSNMDAASGGAASAFDGGSKKATTSDLAGKNENSSSVSGMALGQAITDLKTNDPKLNSNKITPKVTAAKDASEDEDDVKKMLLQMLFSNVIGPVFSSAIGGAMGTGGGK